MPKLEDTRGTGAGVATIYRTIMSEWRLYLFDGMLIYHPIKGREPSPWVRFWTRVFFDGRWVRDAGK